MKRVRITDNLDATVESFHAPYYNGAMIWWHIFPHGQRTPTIAYGGIEVRNCTAAQGRAMARGLVEDGPAMRQFVKATVSKERW